MLDSIKVGNFIMEKRKSLGLTQQQLADKLNVSFQAISKWENGTAYLVAFARLFVFAYRIRP